MLSRSIYNLNRTLEREFAGGKGVSEALHQSLIDVMCHWHKIAMDLEAELEAYQTAGEAVPPVQPRPARPGKLRLVVDNGGDRS